MSIRICVVDDDAQIAEALRLLIQSDRELSFEGYYRDAEQALNGIPGIQPDVVLMDINLGASSGIECVRALKRVMPGLPILMLTVYEDSDRIFQSLVAGASGYLLKRAPKDQLLRAIREVHEGGSPLTSNIARKVVHYFQQLPSAPSAQDFATLTPREQEVLEKLAKGFLYKEIAVDLGIALDTVRKHVRSTYEKLHVRSRSEAIVKYLRK